MKQQYTAICNNPENLYMLPQEYSSKLIMFYIEPRPGKNKVIYCYSLDELKQCLSSEEKLIRHSPIEVKYNFSTGNASREEHEQIQLWRIKQNTHPANWVYLLPTGTFVDSSFVDCINNKQNTIKLTLSEEKAYLFKSFGVSTIHERLSSIYKAEAVDRCSVLNELKLDFKCDESNVFLDNEIIENLEKLKWIYCSRCGNENCFGCDQLNEFNNINCIFSYSSGLPEILVLAKDKNDYNAKLLFYDLFFVFFYCFDDYWKIIFKRTKA